jgi:SH3 domain-containing protein
MPSGPASGAGASPRIGLGAGAWTCALGLLLCLMGCQPGVVKAPTLPPPRPPAPTLSRPVRPTFYVTTNQLSLRACPGQDCHKISTLNINAEVEKMGEMENWTQVKVKKAGTIGYVRSRYLSPHPVELAQATKKKLKKPKPRKASQPPEAAREEWEAGPQQQEPSSPPPRAM